MGSVAVKSRAAGLWRVWESKFVGSLDKRAGQACVQVD